MWFAALFVSYGAPWVFILSSLLIWVTSAVAIAVASSAIFLSPYRLRVKILLCLLSIAIQTSGLLVSFIIAMMYNTNWIGKEGL